MKLTFLQCINLTLFCCFCACSSPQSPKETNEEKNIIANLDTLPSQESIIIERAYATSFQKGFGLETLFDENENTFFQTKKGTGPNEGIMFYFSEPTNLHQLKIELGESSILQTVEIFVNGNLLSLSDCKENINIQDVISSLFIKFKETSENQQRVLNGQETSFLGMEGNVFSFPKDKQINIKKISFYKDEKELKVILPKKIQGTVSASSTLKPTIAYQTANLFDAYLSSAWVEGRNESTGIGEKLTFTSNENKMFQNIKIWNGYQRSSTHFTANCSARKIKIQDQIIELENVQNGEKLALQKPISVQNFSLTIEDVFDNNKKYKDLAISELVFFDEKNEPFIFDCEKELVQTSSEILKKVLNTAIQNHLFVEEQLETTQKSIVLRDDFTFVYYIEYSDESGQNNAQNIVAEGNWEIVKENSKEIQLKLFGKKHVLSSSAEMYGNVENQEKDYIFTDVITITSERLLGGKHIESFVIW